MPVLTDDELNELKKLGNATIASLATLASNGDEAAKTAIFTDEQLCCVAKLLLRRETIAAARDAAGFVDTKSVPLVDDELSILVMSANKVISELATAALAGDATARATLNRRWRRPTE